jgi:heme exporter protein C
MNLHAFATPRQFLRMSARLRPWLAGVGCLAAGTGLYGALVTSPPDYQQGETVRIMYIHVPAAWMAMLAYALLALCSGIYLVWRHPLAGLAARAVAPCGVALTALCLVTGMLWGKPTWGAYWVWDARLTSVLLLLFLFLGYSLLTHAFEDQERGTRAGAILALVGLVNLPVIKFSVAWWNTLHQPASVLRLDGPAIHPAMLWPLLVMAVAYLCWLGLVWLWRIETELHRSRELRRGT